MWHRSAIMSRLLLLSLLAALMGCNQHQQSIEDFNEQQMHGHGSTAPRNLRTLLTAQIQYQSTYPEVGYACSLAHLGGLGPRAGNQPDQTHAMLIDDQLASGHKNGYVFGISHCLGRPASRYVIAAVPDSPPSGKFAYCTDQSAVIRYSTDGKAETCLASGKRL